MNSITPLILALLLAGVPLISIAQIEGQVGTEFTYQGQLSEAGSPADGLFDFEILLFDSSGGAFQLAPPVLLDDVAVSEGIFTVQLDFGPVFEAADEAWLEVRVREGTSGGTYTPLLPRQPVHATPYAQTATSVLPNSIGTVEIDPDQVQRRITGTCGPLSFATAVAADGSVTCGSSLDAGYWQSGVGNAIHYSSGAVGINSADPEFDLHVDGELFVNSGAGRLNIGLPNNGNQWRFSTQGSGGNLQLQSKPAGSFTYTRRMYLNGSTGNVAIGNNSSPDEELVVGSNLGSAWAVPAITVGGTTGGAIQAGNTSYQVSLENSSTFGRARMIVTSPTGFGRGEIEMRTNGLTVGENAGGPGSFMLKVAHGSFGMNLERAGTSNDWELLTSSAAASNLNLYANGAFRGSFSGADGTWNPSSDRQFKADIEPLESVLANVMRLTPSSYRMLGTGGQGRSIGFIAQDVQPLFPDLVHSVDDGRTRALTLNYGGFAVLAIRAIQEQQAMIRSLERSVEELEARIAALERGPSR